MSYVLNTSYFRQTRKIDRLKCVCAFPRISFLAIVARNFTKLGEFFFIKWIHPWRLSLWVKQWAATAAGGWRQPRAGGGSLARLSKLRRCCGIRNSKCRCRSEWAKTSPAEHCWGSPRWGSCRRASWKFFNTNTIAIDTTIHLVVSMANPREQGQNVSKSYSEKMRVQLWRSRGKNSWLRGRGFDSKLHYSFFYDNFPF